MSDEPSETPGLPDASGSSKTSKSAQISRTKRSKLSMFVERLRPAPRERSDRSYGRRMPRVLDWSGRTLVVLGALTLLFVGYQLWGTNYVQAREQRGLKSDFREQLESLGAEVDPSESTTTTLGSSTTRPPTTTTTVALPPPELGQPIGILRIPDIGVDEALVEGVGREELRKGPGHYAHSPFPGYVGNVSIAGHRTTYGAPFFDLDELEPGDPIEIETLAGTFTYRVSETFITDPSDVSVIDHTDDARLTLTTCNPKYSARERLIVVSTLEGEPIEPEPAADIPEPEKPEEPVELPGEETEDDDEPAEIPEEPEITAGLGGSSDAGLSTIDRGTILWTLAALLVGGAWWIAFRSRPRWYTWIGGVVPFLFTLFFFFGEIEELLPANF